jgi:hypothetical protein
MTIGDEVKTHIWLFLALLVATAGFFWFRSKGAVVPLIGTAGIPGNPQANARVQPIQPNASTFFVTVDPPIGGSLQ